MPKNYWTKERIIRFIEENNITSRTELNKFRKDGVTGSGAYAAALKMNILDELFEFKTFEWTKQMCREITEKCETVYEFLTNYPNVYNVVKRRRWFKELTAHMEKETVVREKKICEREGNNYLIYVYEELSTRSAYVGLTNDLDRRDREHRKDYQNRDKLYIFCEEHNIEIPQPKILKYNLTSSEAAEYESIFWHQYKDDGWNMINFESALGSLGGKGIVWTEDEVRKLIIEHPEITSRMQLFEFNSAAYKTAQKYGLLDEFFGENKLKSYTKEDIFKYVEEHPELKMREDLRKAKPGMFKAAWKFGILEDLFGEIPNKEHTEEELIEYLREHPEIKRRTDLFKMNRQMHYVAVKLGLLQHIFGDRQFKSHTEQEIRDFLEMHPEIKSRKELDKANRSLYRAANKLDILVDLFGERHGEKYSEDEVISYMSEHPEIKRIQDLKNNNPRVHNAAYKLKLFDKLFPNEFKYQRNTYTKEDIIAYVAEHPEIVCRDDLLKSNKTLFYLARKFKMLKELFGVYKRKWTKETIKQFIADNPDITRRVDLMNKAMGAYYRANQLKILDELFPKSEN